jgi:U3 small nucleolar RNA-associated protein 20
MYELARSFCAQLESPLLSARLGEQVVKNMLFVIACVHGCPTLAFGDPNMQTVTTDEAPRERLAWSADALQPDVEGEGESEGEGNVDDAAVVATVSSGAKGEDTKATQRDPLSWILHRLSFIAREAPRGRHSRNGTIPRRTAVFRAFAAVAITLPAEVTQRYLVPMIAPLFRAVNALDGLTSQAGGAEAAAAVLRGGSSSAGAPPDEDVVALRALAQEVLDLMEEKVGSTAFLSAYNTARKQAVRVRDARKAERAAERVRDPMLAAQRKLNRNRAKVESRKRKTTERMRAHGKSKPAKRTRREF